MNVIEIENVTKTFGQLIAVKSLSLNVPQGSIYGFIGPNGSGKTTTLRMIMRIYHPDGGSGRIRVLGSEAFTAANDRIGYLPEERGLYKKMTLMEVMMYMAQLKGCSASYVRNNADRWLERMGLMDYKKRKVEELSKGMQQKLQFVTTILHDPDLIILDELFSGLDPLNIELIKDILLERKRAGK
ncbi:MAG: ATP-binding cassette domain-containing protein, partial [Candidatus Krumholzibacteria bacterium]|nr:ATP-binding cassette domain-containing protein [Candidatus Krumholzibacteria bacterium]